MSIIIRRWRWHEKIHDWIHLCFIIGFGFVGWFADKAMTISLSSPYTVTQALTIYAKYEAVPPSQVAFVTNVDGLTVPNQDINYELLATLPVVENQTIEGVLSKVSGWTLNGSPFDFETPITTSIE